MKTKVFLVTISSQTESDDFDVLMTRRDLSCLIDMSSFGQDFETITIVQEL